MPKHSAGILLYRIKNNKTEVFLVHPGGPFWAKKDNRAWSIPKGEHDQSEDSLAAAKREFKEETGQNAPKGSYSELGQVKYGNKIVTAWFARADVDEANIKGNYFEMQWPPKSGETQQFLEVDKAAWFNLTAARRKLVKGQVPLIDMFEASIKPDQQSFFS